MKKIAIIGAGISGLRAALELSEKHLVSLFEKSPSVGGRVATRRFGEFFINHGAGQFDGRESITNDPLAERLKKEFALERAATDLPKAMRALLQENPNFEAHFNTKVLSVSTNKNIRLENGDTLEFDQIIMTAPVPQVRELLGLPILPEIKYSKQVSFIGLKDNHPVKHMLSEDDSERVFEESDHDIRKFSSTKFEDIQGLDLKKWRYSRVVTGLKGSFYSFTPDIIICGDAFDPEEIFNLGSAWKSGLLAARKLL